MTLITDYSSLQDAVLEYLGRNQDTTVTARVPSYIQLSEAKGNRMLFCRQMEERSTTTVDTGTDDPEFITLPSDFQSMRRLRLSSVEGKPPLSFKTGAQMDEYRASASDTPGRPQYFSIIGNEIELAPTPDQNYEIEMVYRKNIPALASNDTNWLLELAPDFYLYGALMEASPALKQDNRISVWAAGLQTAIEGLNKLTQASAYNAGPMQIRVSGQVIV